ncbi:RNA-binding domain-containing protein [Desulfosarcina widdelii]|uniref:RNA-binding domain-containing protein n=1 Tax=Desulfosarcina widdelii TaxID=947919 RepID=UPI0014797089|nr:RNA-binding domain-containing protein [Desulfosarcina widdelii]
MLVFLLLSATVIGSVVFFSSRAREDIAQKTIDNAIVSAVRQFEAMVDSITQSLELTGDWIDSGKLSLNRTSAINDLLFPLLKRERILYGISVADTLGKSYYLTAHGNGWRERMIEDIGGQRQSVLSYWDASHQKVSEETQPTTYDPRNRPWFSPALSIQGVFWTQPYIFFNRKVVGITASIAREADAGNDRVVVALDILLDDLFNEIQRMGPTKHSRVFVFRNDAQIYIPGNGNHDPDFSSFSEVNDPLIRKVAESWEGRHLPSEEVFFIKHEGRTWWYGFQAINSPNRSIWVGVMVPESDIIGGVSQRRTGIWAIGAVIVSLAGALAFLMVRRYGRSFEPPKDRYDYRNPEESIRRLIAKGEGRTIEFKSTMRMNLHTQKPGKEIEVAWLKAVAAFMNTDGGTLLLGVSDDGMIKGLDADGFASDDKCRLHFKNLINQHIGAELYKYLRFDLVRVDGSLIGVVSCSRSVEPVYLKTAKSEEFYIRSGPSSDALPVSKIMAYIKNKS